MKRSVAFLSVFLGLTFQASATVIIGFADVYSGGIATGLKNGSGVVTDGMNWGIIVDTGGDGFSNSGLSYDAYAGGVTTSGFLSANGVATNDYFIVGATTVDGTSLGYTDGLGRTPGHGSILDDTPAFSLTGGLTANESFALVWFGTKTGSVYTSNAGDKYGFLTDSSFKLPADGNTTEFGNPWSGASLPSLSASNTFAAISGVPEPSRMLLVGFGALGLMMRRRRSVV